ncbi:DUF5641 domain-containing protein [Nephila pilipes]|uniref:DUF5641 domain-containing protein n=1 Tax=Nephila pilipes TaxID=299642 RepID=A0A8X6U113_NEPPI|nr:DUF5641 domain-containing protein [Nephila pilipes]
MIKEILRRVLGRSSLNYEELNTILCDCEQIINSRPITHVSEDNRDPAPLTPMMFLQELPSSGIPDIDSVDSKLLSRRAKYRQRIRDNLRNRFRSEYLGQLRQHALKRDVLQKLCVGDVVLVEDINKRRLHWPLAKIIEIFPGRDNVVRLAKVKTDNGFFSAQYRDYSLSRSLSLTMTLFQEETYFTSKRFKGSLPPLLLDRSDHLRMLFLFLQM